MLDLLAVGLRLGDQLNKKNILMNDDLKFLLQLQEKDLCLDQFSEDLESIPEEMEKLKADLEEGKKIFDDFKKENNKNILSRKQKEGELEKKEEEITKHNRELNDVKTNEAYRAILKDIERIKQEKSAFEEDILSLMENIESFNKDVKKKEKEIKEGEAVIQKKIGELEVKEKSKKEEKEIKLKEREEFLSKTPPASLQRYSYIRKAKQGAVLVTLDNDTCGGCLMRVPPHVKTQVLKAEDLVICETCSRILFANKITDNAKTQ